MAVEGRRSGRFDGWWDAEAPLALPGGVGGAAAVLRSPPEGFLADYDDVDTLKEEEEEGKQRRIQGGQRGAHAPPPRLTLGAP